MLNPLIAPVSSRKISVPADFADGALAFASTTGNAFGSAAASAAVLPKIQRPSSISIVGGEYSINGGAYTSASGTIRPGNSVSVRVTAASVFNTDAVATLTVAGVPATFTATSRWQPNTANTTGLILHVDSTGLPASGAVSSWANLANAGFPLVQGASAPTAGTPVNGLRTATFNGTSDRMTGTSQFSQAPHTLLVLAKPTLSGRDIVGTGAASTSGNGLLMTFSNVIRGHVWQAANTITQVDGAAAVSMSAWYVLGMQRTAANLQTLHNGTVEDVTALAGTATTSSSTFILGSRATSDYFQGDISEVLLFSSDLSDAVRDKVIGYMMWRAGLESGLPVGHTYKTVAP